MAGKADGGLAPPFELRSGALRQLEKGCSCSGKQRRGHWSERDLRRALGVARRSGLQDYRVEIAPDGTIALVVGSG